MRRSLKVVGRLALAGLGGLVAFLALAPPLLGNRGASLGDRERPLPGDERVPVPKLASTMAITIHAKPEEVWPWLAQLGQGRGGLYSYDALENLVGCDIHSADRIVPELQALKPGDEIWLDRRIPSPYRVVVTEPGRALVLASGAGETASSWAFAEEPLNGGWTRLLVRSRLTYPGTLGQWLIWRAITEPLHAVMQERMLRGIRDRVERTRLASPPPRA